MVVVALAAACLIVGGDGGLWHDMVPMPRAAVQVERPQPRHKQGVVFLNFDGATISTGIEDSRTNTTLISQVVEGTGGVIPPFGDGPKRDAVLEAVRADWAPFNVTVTDTRPDAGEYTMNLLGPVSPFGGAVLGIAPVDCRDEQTHNNITFTFIGANSSKGASEIATVASQEVAHSFGLEHVGDSGNIMNPSPGPGDPSFEDRCTNIVGDNVCADVHAEFCGTPTAQNTVAELMAIFGDRGPDVDAPLVEITYPEDGAVFEEGAMFEIEATVSDAGGVAVVELYYFGDLLAEDSDEPYSWPAALVPGVHEFYVGASDLVGNVAMSETITIQVGDPPEGSGGGDGGGDDGGDGGPGGDGGSADSGSFPDQDGESDPDAGCGCRSGSGGQGLWLVPVLAAMAARRRRSVLVLTAATLGLGCTAEPSDEDPFATNGIPNVSDSSGGGGDAADDAGSTDGGPASTGADTGSDSADTNMPTNPTITASAGDSDSGGGGGGAQPESGMYSHCLDVSECGPVPVCLRIQDMDGMTFDGICTISTCSNAAADCDPAPGGTAQPFCVPVGTESDCALDCSNGETCATGMICMDVGTAMICV